MGKEIKYSPEVKKLEKELLKKIESSPELYLERYTPEAIAEFEYLVSEGFYDSIYQPMVDDIILGGELYKTQSLNNKKKILHAIGML